MDVEYTPPLDDDEPPIVTNYIIDDVSFIRYPTYQLLTSASLSRIWNSYLLTLYPKGHT